MIFHLNLDLETLDTRPTSVILSLGCSLFAFEESDKTFDHYIETGFYVKLNATEQIRSGRTTSKDTINWWKTQGEEAKSVLFPQKTDKTLQEGLMLLVDYLNNSRYNFKKSYCWCRGSSFDWPIVDNAFEQHSIKLPYNGWKIRDTKTAIDIMAGTDNGAYNLKNGTPREFIKHNSLHDCVLDILRLKELYDNLS